MANTNINIRMDIDLKRQFEAFCADMGMSMSTAFTIFARKAVREYRIPFEIDGIAPNPETIKEALQKPLFPSRIEQNRSVRFFFTTSKNGVFFAIKIV